MLHNANYLDDRQNQGRQQGGYGGGNNGMLTLIKRLSLYCNGDLMGSVSSGCSLESNRLNYANFSDDRQSQGRQQGGYGGGGGGYSQDNNDFSSAAQHAQQHAGSAGDSNIFSSVLSHLTQNQGNIANQGVNEQGMYRDTICENFADIGKMLSNLTSNYMAIKAVDNK